MRIKGLNQKDFRNLKSPEVQFSNGLNFLFGRNAQGKTNFLEAISLVHHGRSFRPVSQNALVNDQNILAEAHLHYEILRKGVTYHVRISIVDGKTHLLVDNKTRSSRFLSERFPVLVFSPESLDAIKGGPDQRRYLVDQSLVFIDPNYAQILESFSKVLRTRNRVLKDIKSEKLDFADGKQVLKSLEPNFLTLSTELITRRIAFLNEFAPTLSKTFQNFAGNAQKKLDFSYQISSEEAKFWDTQKVYYAIQNRLKELESAELALGTSLSGPQKNEIVFLVNEKDSRYFCSQGQQRSLILSFKMAQIMYHYTAHGDYPVLLLDDVLSELDETNRKSLVSFLSDLDAQIFLTATEVGQEAQGLLSKQKPNFYEIENGIIERFSEGRDEERATYGESAQ